MNVARAPPPATSIGAGPSSASWLAASVSSGAPASAVPAEVASEAACGGAAVRTAVDIVSDIPTPDFVPSNTPSSINVTCAFVACPWLCTGTGGIPALSACGTGAMCEGDGARCPSRRCVAVCRDDGGGGGRAMECGRACGNNTDRVGRGDGGRDGGSAWRSKLGLNNGVVLGMSTRSLDRQKSHAAQLSSRQ